MNESKKEIAKAADENHTVTDLIEIPKEVERRGSELFSNKEELIINLKELHMQQQSDLVK